MLLKDLLHTIYHDTIIRVDFGNGKIVSDRKFTLFSKLEESELYGRVIFMYAVGKDSIVVLVKEWDSDDY